MPPKKIERGDQSARGATARSAPARRSTSEEGSSSKVTGRGWGVVAAKKKQSDSQSSKNKPPYLDIKHKFFLVDGESAIIQFANEEPFCVDGCNIPPDFRDFYVSPKTYGQRHCPMVDSGLKLVWRAGFKVWDFRGEYDKDTKRHKGGDPVEKYWLVSNTVSLNLDQLRQKYGKPLTELVFEVTRSGSDKNTSYNFQRALDRHDRIIKPDFSLTEKLPSLEVALKALPDEQLKAILGLADDDDDTPRARIRTRED